MPFKEFKEVYRSCDYSKKFKIQLSEDERYILSELFNPRNLLRLFGVIEDYNNIKSPKADAKAHIQIDYYTRKVENKYPVIKNQLSLAMLYSSLSNATMINKNLYEVVLNPMLVAELEYTVSHDILRKLKSIDELKEELDDINISESYKDECKNNISNTKREIETYENILIQVTKTIGKDGIYLVQNDMEECELEGLNGLKLHIEACRKEGK